MKKANLYALLIGAGFVLLMAGSSRSAPLPQQRATFSQQRVVPIHVRFQAEDEDEQQEQTYKGTINKSGEKFVLVGEDSVTYNLDDQDKAKDFEGKKVKVTGKLDKDSNTIHVSGIEALEEEPG